MPRPIVAERHHESAPRYCGAIYECSYCIARQDILAWREPLEQCSSLHALPNAVLNHSGEAEDAQDEVHAAERVSICICCS